MMKIGELAKRTGLAASRIRFYEKMGLLKMVDREANGYRLYPEEAVLVLELIKSAQEAGFSLEELRHVMPPDLNQWEHSKLDVVLREQAWGVEETRTIVGLASANTMAAWLDSHGSRLSFMFHLVLLLLEVLRTL